MRFELLLVLSLAVISIQEDPVCKDKFIPVEGATQAEMQASINVVVLDPTKCLDSCNANDGWKMYFINTDCTKTEDNIKMCLSNLYISSNYSPIYP